VIKGFIGWPTRAAFSTSRGRGIFTDTALDERPPTLALVVDRQRPGDFDTDFSIARFAADVNKDRPTCCTGQPRGSLHGPSRRPRAERRAPGEREQALASEVDEHVAWPACHERLEFRQAAARPVRSARANSYRRRLRPDSDQVRPRARRGRHAHRAQSCAACAVGLERRATLAESF
jgi:hypothetical protein